MFGKGLKLDFCNKPLESISYHLSIPKLLNSLPNDKILDWSKFKAFADDKINGVEQLKFALGRAKNIVGKEENAGYQHFFLF